MWNITVRDQWSDTCKALRTSLSIFSSQQEVSVLETSILAEHFCWWSWMCFWLGCLCDFRDSFPLPGMISPCFCRYPNPPNHPQWGSSGDDPGSGSEPHASLESRGWVPLWFSSPLLSRHRHNRAPERGTLTSWKVCSFMNGSSRMRWPSLSYFPSELLWSGSIPPCVWTFLDHGVLGDTPE